MSEKYANGFSQYVAEEDSNNQDNFASTVGKYSNLTNMKLFDSLSLTRKMQAQENFSQITKVNDKASLQSPFKDSQCSKNEDFVQQQINEISRLKKENLHFQLKTQELDNYKIILEDQLSQKNEFSLDKESRLQDEINKYKDENNTLKNKLQKLENECREQDDGFYQYKKVKENEIEQQKIQMQHQNENQLNRELKELNQKHDQEKQHYQSEIQKEQEMIRVYQEETKILQNQNKEQQLQIMTLKKLEDKIKEKDNIIMCLHGEIDLKIDLLGQKTHESENHKQQNRELDAQMSNSQKDSILTIQKKENIIGEQEKQLTKLRKDKDNLLIVQQKYYDSEIQIQNQYNEAKKLNSTLNERNSQIDKLNIQLLAAQSSLKKNEDENQKLDEKVTLMSQEIDLLQNNLISKKDDFQRLQTKYHDMDSEYIQYKQTETKKSLSKDEQIDSLSHENAQQKEKIQENQVFILQQTHLIQQQQQSLANQSQKQINMNQEMLTLQENNAQKTSEIEELNNQVQKYKPYQNQSVQQEKQLDLLLTEIERLNRLLIDYINENETLIQQKTELQKYVGWFKEKDSEVQQLEQEIKILLAKNQNMIKLQFQCNDQDNDLKSVRIELERHAHQIQSKNKEILLFQNKNSELENNCSHLSHEVKQIPSMKLEMERIQLSLIQKDQELEDQKDQIYELQILKKKYQENLGLITILYAQIESSQKSNQVLPTNRYS